TVQLFDGNTLLDTKTIDASGQATFFTTQLSAGLHSITATFLKNDNSISGTSDAVGLQVDRADLTITASDRSKTYGQSVTFAGTEFTTSGLLNSDTVTSVALTSGGAVATSTVAGSPYSIVASNAVGSGLDNYTIHFANGSLMVNRALLSVGA